MTIEYWKMVKSATDCNLNVGKKFVLFFHPIVANVFYTLQFFIALVCTEPIYPKFLQFVFGDRFQFLPLQLLLLLFYFI